MTLRKSLKWLFERLIESSVMRITAMANNATTSYYKDKTNLEAIKIL